MKKLMLLSTKWIMISIIFLGILIVIIYEYKEPLCSTNYIYDGEKQSIESRSDNRFYISEIFDFNCNNNYIIAKRIPQFNYVCDGREVSFYEDRIEYILINKKSGNIYCSYNEQVFHRFINKLNIDLFFSENSTQRMETKIKFYRENDRLHHIETRSICREDPVKNFTNKHMVKINKI